jgi:hypothetical protein
MTYLYFNSLCLLKNSYETLTTSICKLNKNILINTALNKNIFLFIFSLSILLFSNQLFSQTAPQDPENYEKPIFSHRGGFYQSNFPLRIDVPDQTYSIIYTIDGSNPQDSPTAQSGGKSKTIQINPNSTSGRPQTPCFIVRASLKKDGGAVSLPVTQTYIFINNVINQSNPGGGWPTGSYVNDQEIDLPMDSKVTKSSKFSNLIDDALLAIPSLSVVTDQKNLFDSKSGIYVNAMQHGDEWERFCSVELINPNGNEGFNVNAGLRIRGGWSRHGYYPKHGFRLFFRGTYGDAKLRYPLFGNEGVGEFDKIDLRCEQNYAWNNGDSRNTGVREVFSRDTQRDMGQPYTRSRYYHLYLNGMYWGLFQTQERSEARYAADYFGGSKEDYDVVKVDAQTYTMEATDGDLNGWKKLFDAYTKGFVSNADYFALEGRDQNGYPKKGGEILLDIDNLIDYMLTIFYAGNFDAPITSFRGNNSVNNFYTLYKRDDKTKGFIFFNHDAEHSLMIDPAPPGIGLYENRIEINYNATSISNFNPQVLHNKLAENKEYRLRFADRVYKHFFNEGVFVPEIAEERFRKRTKEIDVAIIAESARWGDAKTSRAFTRDDWELEINNLYDDFFPYRTDIVIDQLIDANLFPNINPVVYKDRTAVLSKPSYAFTNPFELSVSSDKGMILVTTDGSDPRLVGGGINLNAKTMNNGETISIEGTTIVKSRVKIGDTWSALSVVTFVDNNEDYSNLKVTELHYHPTDSISGKDTVSGKSFEFIELKNIGKNTINLSGLTFTSSIEYMVEENTLLPPKGFYVIASKPKWFYERYAQVPSGNFSKNFSNSGERVRIISKKGTEVIQFDYSDSHPWTKLADGQGHSLSAVERYPSGNPNNFSYWRASSELHGSPFSDDPGIMDHVNELDDISAHLKIFPNPTKGTVYFSYQGLNGFIEIDIMTISGSKVFSGKIENNGSVSLNDLSLNPGIYLFKARTNGKVRTYKVIYRP